jgi:hypothetical protein
MGEVRRQITKALLLSIFAVLAMTPWQQAKASGLYTFTSHIFTPCGATGWTGPTLLNCTLGAYSNQAWTGNSSNFNVVGGIQYWTVPLTGSYTIAAAGAKGGGNGGLGAIETGTFSLTQGAVIRILVGQEGMLYGYGSGGGGTFVVASPYNSNASILVIAGGGGGSYVGNCSVNAGGQTTPSPIGGTYSAASGGGGGGSTNAAGGVGFTNGVAVGASTYAGGGAGFGGNGGRYRNNLVASGLSFINGGKGGEAYVGALGGFGGGGGIGDRPGGGGGYSGGNSENSACGIGGGSYNSGPNISEVANRNNGAGYVSIAYNAPPISSLNVSLSAGGNLAAYRTTTQITASVSTNGKVTFFQNGKRIAGCLNVQSNSLVAYCNWRATKRGTVTLTARLIPSTDFLPSLSTNFNVLVENRSTQR